MTEWDGRPPNPERDGWHWMTDAEMPCRPWCEYWNGRDSWAPLGGTPDAVRRMWRYLGPCLTPAEIEQRERAARAAALEEAASFIECGCKNRHNVVMQRPNSAARWSLCEHPNCMMIEAAAIRALAKETYK